MGNHQVSYGCADIDALADAINIYNVMVPRRMIVGLTPTDLALDPILLRIVHLTLM